MRLGSLKNGRKWGRMPNIIMVPNYVADWRGKSVIIEDVSGFY